MPLIIYTLGVSVVRPSKEGWWADTAQPWLCGGVLERN